MKISQFKSALQLAKPTDNPQFLQSNGVPVSAQNFGFQFTTKKTTCLAPDHCGISNEQLPLEMQKKNTTCTPNSGCC
jgi:hypothetical protein